MNSIYRDATANPLWENAELITETHAYAAHTFAGKTLSTRGNADNPGDELRALL
jgi:hypothetical protein